MSALIPVNEFSLPPSGEGEYRRRLLLRGLPTPKPLLGTDIAFQLRAGELFLVGLDDDYYDGVTHQLYLLDGQGRLLQSSSVPDTFAFAQGQAEADGSVLLTVPPIKDIPGERWRVLLEPRARPPTSAWVRLLQWMGRPPPAPVRIRVQRLPPGPPGSPA